MRRFTKDFGLVVTLAVLLALVLASVAWAEEALSPKEQLGKLLFFDTNLSTPTGMACATCHDPAAGFADPRTDDPVSQGVLPQFFGDRNSPTAAYAQYSPAFHEDEDGWVGGQFWDGRALDLAEQAKGPFLNPLEMRNPNKTVVVNKVRKADYADIFVDVYGPLSLKNVEEAYDNVADAIAAYEASEEVSPFTSKYDYFIRGQAKFTQLERMGMVLYSRSDIGCSTCHPLEVPADLMGGGMGGGTGPGGGMGGPGGGGTGPGGGGMGGGGMGGGGMGGGGMGPGGGGGMGGGMTLAPGATITDGNPTNVYFSDFRYKNLGTPANPLNPFYTLPPAFNPLGDLYVDYGLGKTLRAMGFEEEVSWLEDGKMKTPTLRNVAATPPYMHNGVFSTLMEVVHFYNTGNVLLSMNGPNNMVDEYWPPEVDRNVDDAFVGGLDLNGMQGMALVAFMETLTDGYDPTQE